MSIGFILGGVPVNVTFPVIDPPAGRAAVTSTAEPARAKTANRAKNFVRMISTPLFLLSELWTYHIHTGRMMRATVQTLLSG
jgi:hypothetical protein